MMESVAIAPDTSQHQVDVAIRDRGTMRYPSEERMHSVMAQAITAYIVDTLGRIEPATVTFLGEPPPSEFRRAICDWSRTVRVGTPRIDGKTTRVLLLRAWDFSVGTPSRRPPPNMLGFWSMLQHMTPADAAAWLRQMPRCQQ